MVGIQTASELCSNSDLLVIINLLKTAVNLLQILIPIGLIVFGLIDLGKAVIASKEDEMKKAQGNLIKRVMYAVLVFLVVTIVSFVMGMVGSTEWKECWHGTGNPNSVETD